MKSLLMSTALAAMLLLTAGGANAAVIANLGVNPKSAQGNFSNSVGGATFTDQYTFQLVGGPLEFSAVAGATNVFINPIEDPITNFTASVFQQVGMVGGGDDILKFGPNAATIGCGPISACQVVAVAGLLSPGNYYLEFKGMGGGTSGYSGNFSSGVLVGAPSPVPLPGAVLLFGSVLGLGGLLGWRRRRSGAALAA